MDIKGFIAVIGTALALSGCFSLDTAEMKWSGEEHVVARNYGWSLFNCIPLLCGNANPDGATGCAFFRDDVTPEKVQARFMAYAGDRQVLTPVFTNYDSVIITVFGIPVPYVVCYKEVALSGTLK